MKLQIVNDNGQYTICTEGGETIDNIMSVDIKVTSNGITAYFKVAGLNMVVPVPENIVYIDDTKKVPQKRGLFKGV